MLSTSTASTALRYPYRYFLVTFPERSGVLRSDTCPPRTVEMPNACAVLRLQSADAAANNHGNALSVGCSDMLVTSTTLNV